MGSGTSVLRIVALGGMLVFCPNWGAHGQVATRFSLPEPTGPYAVGRILEDWTDDSRIDPLATDTDSKRILPVTIWYPAASSKPPAQTAYFPSPLLEYFPQEKDHWSHVIERAPLSKEATQFPVLILKPGFGFLALQYSALAEDLASQGYVVAGSDSPHTTPLSVYQDGRAVRRTEKGAPRSAEDRPDELAPGERNGATLSAFAVWVQDNRFVLDRLEALNAGPNAGGAGGMFVGRLGLDRVGALGHSYGGAVALEFCRVDLRCDAAVNIDGAPLGEVVRTGLKTPALFIFSDRPALRAARDEGPAPQRALLAAIDRIETGLPNRPNQVVLAGAGHFNFADPALYIDVTASRRAGALGPIDPAQGMAETSLLLRTFFDIHLRSRGSPTLEEVAASHSELLLQ